MTIDTNIAFYAFARDENAAIAKSALGSSEFLSTQVLNEFALSSRRKLRREWSEIAEDIAIMREAVGQIVPIDSSSNRDALRIAESYRLNFYDAVMIAVALAHGASTLYSEDMRHGLVIDGALTIINPFLSSDLP